MGGGQGERNRGQRVRLHLGAAHAGLAGDGMERRRHGLELQALHRGKVHPVRRNARARARAPRAMLSRLHHTRRRELGTSTYCPPRHRHAFYELTPWDKQVLPATSSTCILWTLVS